MSKILVVDDELSIRETFEILLTREGYSVDVAAGGLEAITLFNDKQYDLVITDIRMPGMSGVEVLKSIKAVSPRTKVILISAYPKDVTADDLLAQGAYDLFTKPFDNEDIKSVVRNALGGAGQEEVKRFGALVGDSEQMKEVYRQIWRAAQTSTNILITGQSGTGKELVARAIHDHSNRAEEMFVAINCGGMPEQLIESELFGYKKGAFTGATMDKRGLFEVADKGTIFLDELGELTMPIQVKLLRVVQERTFRSLGGTKEHSVDVRFIAATNKNLENEIKNRNFREDLYYRLNVLNIHMPPLQDRGKEDVRQLAHHFLNKYSSRLGKDISQFSVFALKALEEYHYPGNVRELENIIERAVALTKTSIILPESLSVTSFENERRMGPPPKEQLVLPAPEEIIKEQTREKTSLDDVLDALEMKFLILALREAENVKSKAADLLGISSWRLRGRLKKLGLIDLGFEELVKMAEQQESVPGAPEDLVPEWDGQRMDLDMLLRSVERRMILEAMDKVHGSKERAAEELGISRRKLLHRITRSVLNNDE